MADAIQPSRASTPWEVSLVATARVATLGTGTTAVLTLTSAPPITVDAMSLHRAPTRSGVGSAGLVQKASPATVILNAKILTNVPSTTGVVECSCVTIKLEVIAAVDASLGSGSKEAPVSTLTNVCWTTVDVIPKSSAQTLMEAASAVHVRRDIRARGILDASISMSVCSITVSAIRWCSVRTPKVLVCAAVVQQATLATAT